MRCFILTFALCAFLLLPAVAESGSGYFHGSASNIFYAWQDAGYHLRARQALALNAGSGSWLISGSLGGLLDFNSDFKNLTPARDYLGVYSLYAGSRELLDHKLTLLVGRQFLSPGLSVGCLDGVYAAYAFSPRFAGSAYVGVDALYDRSARIYNISEGVTTGATFDARRLFDNQTDAQFFYLVKASDAPFWEIGGVNLRNRSFTSLTLSSQLQFDFLNERFHRAALSCRKEITTDLEVGAGISQTYPQIYSNAYFSYFRISARQVLRADADWTFYKSLRVHGQYRFLNFEADNAQQVSATLGNDNGGVGLLFETGYSGRQISLTADYSRDLGDYWNLSANIDYSKYKSEEQLSFENSLANALRASCRLGRSWQISLEGQWMMNPLKDYDARVLNRVQYRW